MTLAISIITALILSITTAIVTVHLSLRRFRAERLWERRVDAYQAVMVALHRVSRYCDQTWATEYNPMSTRKPTEADQQKIREAYAEIHKWVDLSAFLLSDAATDCLDNLEKTWGEARQAMNRDDFLAYLTDVDVAVKHCLKSLRVIAKADIKKLQI